MQPPGDDYVSKGQSLYESEEGGGRESERGEDRELEMVETQFRGPFRVFKCFKCSHLTMRPAMALSRAFSSHNTFVALIALSKQS